MAVIGNGDFRSSGGVATLVGDLIRAGVLTVSLHAGSTPQEPCAATDRGG